MLETLDALDALETLEMLETQNRFKMRSARAGAETNFEFRSLLKHALDTALETLETLAVS